MMDAHPTPLVTLDQDEDARRILSLEVLRVAAQGTGRSALAAQAALDAYLGERESGSTTGDAAVVAKAALSVAMKG